MPALDEAPASDVAALVAYFGSLGTPAANVPAVFRPPPQSPLPAGGDIRFSAMKRVSLDGLQNQSQTFVDAGRQVFQERACFACHGEAGSGGREPAIAPLIAKISDAQLKELLASPNAKMTAGGMPPVTATPEQLDALVSYLRSLPLPSKAKADEPLAHSDRTKPTEDRAPVTPSYAYSPPSSVAVTPTTQPAPTGRVVSAQESAGSTGGRAIFLSQGCLACHGQFAQGTRIAPSLIGIGSKFPGDRLFSLLRHPTDKMRGGGMPTVKLDDPQLAELVAYLGSLQTLPSNPPQSPPIREVHLTATQPALEADRAIQSASVQRLMHR